MALIPKRTLQVIEGQCKYGRYEIRYDGWSVWINTLSCIARLGQEQGELWYSGHIIDDAKPNESFGSWRKRVKDIFQIDVPEQVCPYWEGS